MSDKELDFVDDNKDDNKDDSEKKNKRIQEQSQELEQLKGAGLQLSNEVKNSIKGVTKVLGDIMKNAGYKMSTTFKEVGAEETLESEVAPDGPDLEAVIGAFDSIYGEGAAMVKGVFQGLSQVVMSMAESVGFQTTFAFAKAEEQKPDADPEKDPDPNADPNSVENKKKKEEENKDPEKLTEIEQALCDEMEKLQTELEQESLSTERYTEILTRIGVIENELKGGEKK